MSCTARTAIIEKPARLTNSRLWRHRPRPYRGPMDLGKQVQTATVAHGPVVKIASPAIHLPASHLGWIINEKGNHRASYTLTSRVLGQAGDPCPPAVPTSSTVEAELHKPAWPEFRNEPCQQRYLDSKAIEDTAVSGTFSSTDGNLLTPGSAGETPALPAARFP